MSLEQSEPRKRGEVEEVMGGARSAFSGFYGIQWRKKILGGFRAVNMTFSFFLRMVLVCFEQRLHSGGEGGEGGEG